MIAEFKINGKQKKNSFPIFILRNEGYSFPYFFVYVNDTYVNSLYHIFKLLQEIKQWCDSNHRKSNFFLKLRSSS